MGYYAFALCPNLVTVTLGDGLTTISQYAFCYCSNLTTVTFGTNITSIDADAFMECDSLTEMIIPETVTNIGAQAFWSCDNLSDITIPNGVTSIGWNTFGSCASLTTITIPDSVTSISDYAFEGSALTSIIIPGNVTAIGNYAFYDCNSLSQALFQGDAPSMGDNVFDNTALDFTIYYYSDATGFTTPTWEGYPCEILIYTSGGFTYAPTGSDTAVITAYTGSGGEVVIPETINDYTITGIGESAFSACTTITSIVIPSSVTDIGDEAFYGCSSLTQAIFEGNAPTIGTDVFTGTASDFTVYYYSYRTGFTTPTWEGYSCSYVTVENGDFVYRPTGTDTAIIVGYSGSGGDISIPAILDGYTITAIGDRVFYDCDTLTSVTFPEGIIWIGDYAFYDCDGLTELILPNGLQRVGASAFAYCEFITSFTLPDSITVIAASAFDSCCRMDSVVLPNQLQRIGNRAFYNCGLEYVVIPDSVTAIENFAFGFNNDCAFYVPNSVTSMDDRVFDADEQVIFTCSGSYAEQYAIEHDLMYLCVDSAPVSFSLVGFPDKSVYTPGEAMSTIGMIIRLTTETGAIYDMHLYDDYSSLIDGLASVSVPETCGVYNYTVSLWGQTQQYSYTVTQYPDYPEYIIQDNVLMEYVGSSSTLEVPDGVTEIAAKAFYHNDTIEHLILPSSIETVSEDAFNNADSLIDVVINGDITDFGERAFAYCDALTSVTINGTVTKIELDSFAYNDSLMYFSCESIYEIQNGAFIGCDNLTSVMDLHLSEYVGKSAFGGCQNLNAVILPDACENYYIGDNAFGGCSSLTSITLPQGTTSIGNSAFKECSALSAMQLPEGITSIGAYAFQRCSSLDALYLPESISSIGEDAFFGMTAEFSYTEGSYAEEYLIDNHIISNIESPVVSIHSASNTIFLSWQSCEGAVEYYVYQCGDETEKLVGNTTDTKFTDTNLSNGVEYTYLVIAYYNDASLSSYSEKYRVSATPVAKPSVKATEGDESITLNWGAATGATSYTIYSYDGKYHSVATTTETSYTITGLRNGVTYRYLVRGYNASGANSYSTNDLVTAQPIAAPETNADSATGSIKLSWGAVTGAKLYKIYSYDGSYHFIATTTSTSYRVSGLTNGTEYTYLVRAYNEYGGSAYGEEDLVSATPLAKASVKAAVDDGSVMLNWSAVVGATSYKIYSYDGGYHSVATTTETSYTITGLTNGTTYRYLVRVYSDEGASSYSSSDLITVKPIAAPEASVYASTGSVKLSWSAVTGATSYKIYSYDGSYHYVGSTTGTSYTASGLTNGTEYRYLVRAYNEYGGSAYGEEDLVSATPVAKASVKAAVDDGSVTLNWSAVVGATKYKIFYYNGSYQYVDETTELSYELTGLTNGTTYRYLVRVYSDEGASSYSTDDLVMAQPIAE